MMLTEEEAKTKWCPFVRMVDLRESDDTFNRVGPPAALNCIASACMAWRWVMSPGERRRHPNGTDWIIEREPQPTTLGFCGLAWKL